jgi:probable rRNA maturation factor
MLDIKFNNQTDFRLPRQLMREVLIKAARYLKLDQGDLSVAFVKPVDIQRLNSLYRHKKQVTDVLSFAYVYQPRTQYLEGEIIICPAVAAKQAKTFKHSFRAEITKLLVHSLLHLVGHDHQHARQAARMAAQEEKIIALLKK